MLGVKVPIKIACEDAAYALAGAYIEKGYAADVKCLDGVYCTVISKPRPINNIIGNPAVIRASFFELPDGTGIQVREGGVELTAGTVVKEVLLYALVVPGIVKRVEAAKLERAVMRKALIIIKKMGEKNP